MQTRKIWLALLALLVGVAVAAGADCPCRQSEVVSEPGLEHQTDPSVWTDKADYAPGETVHVSGSGFDPGVSLTIKVTRPDGSVVAGDGSFAPWPTAYDAVVVDAEGGFEFDYVLDGIQGEYLVEALVGEKVAAQCTFTDTTFPRVTAYDAALSCSGSVQLKGCFTDGNKRLYFYVSGDTSASCPPASAGFEESPPPGWTYVGGRNTDDDFPYCTNVDYSPNPRPAAGAYSILVRRYDGRVYQDCATLTVEICGPPTCGITGPDGAICASSSEKHTYEWDGSGATGYSWVVKGGTESGGGDSGDDFVKVRWASPGRGSVCVTGHNSYGDSPKCCKEVMVIPVPTASISVTPGCGTGTVTVTSTWDGEQTFYVEKSGSGGTQSWIGSGNSHTFTGLSDGQYRGKVKNACSESAWTSGETLSNHSTPSITCPANVDLGCDPTDTSPATAGTATATCGSVNITHSDTSSTGGCVTTITRTWTATDTSNNTDTCTQSITYTSDAAAPTFTCPTGSDLGCNPGTLPTCDSVKAVVTGLDDACDPSPTLNCQAGTITGTCEKSQTFTLTATDACSNTSDPCDVTYTWKVDTTAPVLPTLPTGGDLGCNPTLPSCAEGLKATDNCDGQVDVICIPGMTVVEPPSDHVSVTGDACNKSQVFTYSATDACGNKSSADVTYAWKADTTAPVLTAPADVTVECDAVPEVGTATTTDNCDSSPTVTYKGEVRSNGACADSYTLTRTWEAVDNCGNTTTKSQIITVQDTTPPSIGTPTAIGTCYVTEALAQRTAAKAALAVSTDSCSATLIATAVTVGDCSAKITVTVADGCGNVSTPVDFSTRIDNTLPDITCPPDVTIKCNESTDPSDTGTATATDTCDPSPTITHSDVSTQTSNGTCTDFSYTITRTWTATDGCDNSSSCEQTITVQDTTPPSITTHASDLTVECDGAGNTAQLNAWLTNNGGAVASDACSGVTWANDFTVLSDDCGATGSATVTFTATDDCGNTSTTSATFTIEDTIAPEIALTVTPPDPNNAPDPYFEWHAADSGNCSPPSELVHEYQLDGGGWVATSGPGVNFVTLNDVPEGGHTFEVRATDACGNTGLQDTYTWLVDLTGPVITILVPEQDGEYLMNDSVLADWTVVDLLSALASAGAVDATGAPVPSGTPFDTSELGDDNFLTVTARDAAGNTGTLTHDYTVVVVKNPGGGDGDVAGGGGAVEVPAGGWLDHSIMGGGGAVGLQEVEAFYYVGEVIHAAFSLTDALGENVPNAVNTLTVVHVTFDGEEEFYDVLLPLYGFTYDSDLQLYTLDIETEPVISTDPFVTAPWEPSVYDLMLGFEDESGVRLRIVVEAAPGGMAFAVECCM